MIKVGEFKVVTEGVFFAVREVQEDQDLRDARHCGLYGSIAPLGAGADKRAEEVAAYLTREHAKGRVPQSVCGPIYAPRTKPDEPRVLIHAAAECDFERINSPEMLTEAQRSALVFCDRHKGAFR